MSESSGTAGRVLVVDDTRANRELLKGLLSRDGYSVETADDGEAGLIAVRSNPPDLVLLDVMMPKLDGFEVCRRIKQDPLTRLIPVVLLTALREREDKINGLNAGADDFLTKPVNAHELRARTRSLVRLKRHTDDLKSAETMMHRFALSVEARDGFAQGRGERVARYAVALGTHRDLSEADLGALHRGGLLHDLGMVSVPEAILQKPARLTADEYETMKRHTVAGEAMCGDLQSLRLVRPIIRHHHEKLDGSGYPDGLRGESIPLLAQIIGLADVYDALTTHRPYRLALTQERACEELKQEADRGWRDRTLVDDFILLVRSGRLDADPMPATPPSGNEHNT